MDTHLIFQWHQLYHFILPMILMTIFYRKLGFKNTGILIFLAGVAKEIRDRIMYQDPYWLSGIDLVFNLIGITLGILLCMKLTSLVNKFRHVLEK